MKTLIALLLVSLAQNATAETVTIDFESKAHNSPSASYGNHIEEGYHIYSRSGDGFWVLGDVPSGFVGSGANYVNSATFANISPFYDATLVRTDNQLFSLSSIDLARFIGFNGTSPFSVTFTGLLASGGNISETVTYVGGSNGIALQTFTFQNLIDVSQVSWEQGISASSFQFDNIVVTSAVPEPAALLLLATGLPCLIGFRRRFSA